MKFALKATKTDVTLHCYRHFGYSSATTVFLFVFWKACRKISSSALSPEVWEAGDEAGLWASQRSSHSLRCNPHKSCQENWDSLLILTSISLWKHVLIMLKYRMCLPKQRIWLYLKNKSVVAVTLKWKYIQSYLRRWYTHIYRFCGCLSFCDTYGVDKQDVVTASPKHDHIRVFTRTRRVPQPKTVTKNSKLLRIYSKCNKYISIHKVIPWLILIGML